MTGSAKKSAASAQMAATDPAPFFCQALVQASRQHGELPAFMSDTRMLNHGAFATLTQAIARRMARDGIGRGSLVALTSNDAAVSMATLIATGLLGAEFVVASRLLAQRRPVRPTHFLRTPEAAGSPHVPFQVIDATWLRADIGDGTAPDGWAGPAQIDAPWMTLYTMGSTGEHKFFRLSQAVMEARASAAAEDYAPRSVTAAFLYGYGALAFFTRAFGLLMRGCAIVESADPEVWRHAGVTLVCAPTMAAQSRFASEASMPLQAALSPRITLECGGAALTPAVALRLLDRFDTVVDSYDISETGKVYGLCLQRDGAGGLRRASQPTNSKIEIVNDRDQPCATGTIGRVRIRNGQSATGYLASGGPATGPSAQAFRDGWFYPGDMALWRDDGLLELQGRTEDIFTIAGQQMAGRLIDLVLTTVPGVRAALSFMDPRPGVLEGTHAFIEVESGANGAECVFKATALCQEELGYVFAPRKIHVINRIPRTEKGEPSRTACQDLVLERLSGHDRSAPRP